MDADEVLAVLHATVDAVAASLDGLVEWRLADDRAHHGQYTHDQVADAAAIAVLGPTGLAILSEESGLRSGTLPVTVVVDPVDGSTNAARGLPWWATSLCAVDREGPWVALVSDQVSGRRWSAIRGRGAACDGVPFARPPTPPMNGSIIGLGGLPPFHFGWSQFRSLGAIALDLCAVADGRLDSYTHCVADEVAEWDYLGGLLICQEAGAYVVDVLGRDLVVLDPFARRTPCAAGDEALLAEVVAARRRFP
ncbi:MAG TPA: inositol monophosphatase family protein [Acidimicrobiales bacterium]|jgi:fructose-1,6-bisphosphatase/inositol monophosphatase family enzyme|nr:inositol monophosphatase family protein [Acidimicrobiales bacterium]